MQNVSTANTSASPGPAPLVPDSGRLFLVDWAQLVPGNCDSRQPTSGLCLGATPFPSQSRAFQTAPNWNRWWQMSGICFLPGQVRHATVTKMAYRVQQPSESLPKFFESISGASALLIPHFSERDMLDTVLNVLNRPTRTALAVFPAACSLTDLLALAPRVQMVHALGQGQPVSRPEATQCRVEYQQHQNSTSAPTSNASYRRTNHNFSNLLGQSFAPRIPKYPFKQNQQRSRGANQPPQYQGTNHHGSSRNCNSSGYGQGNARGGHRYAPRILPW